MSHKNHLEFYFQKIFILINKQIRGNQVTKDKYLFLPLELLELK